MSEPAGTEDRDASVGASAAIPSREPGALPRWVLPVGTGVGGLLIGLALGGVVGGVIGSTTTSARVDAQRSAEATEAEAAASELFRGAVRACGANQSYALVEDDGRTLTLEHEGEEDSAGLDASEVWCIVEELDAPAAVISHMEQTTSMDGRQSEAWDNIEVSWSYHPDRGMDSVWRITE
ncbi:hypothetical protein ABIQ69_01645 [Agromyces sp. G08B096]|uniref:Uncharacterized protein n=1 Tax=Agromyces sp. G08B096 TaxID=3156399 RepID=A0AAU7W7K6_9MICO